MGSATGDASPASNSPDWRMKRALENAQRAGFAPDAFAKKLQRARENPDQAMRESVARSGNNAKEVARRFAEARARVQVASGADQSAFVDMEPFRCEDADSGLSNLQTDVRGLPVWVDQSETRQQPRRAEQSSRQTAYVDERRTKKPRVQTNLAPRLQSKSSETTSPASNYVSPVDMVSPPMLGQEDLRMSNASSPMSPLAPAQSTQEYRIPAALPQWYAKIQTNNYQMKQLDKKRPQSLQALDALKGYIKACENETNARRRKELVDNLRNEVHKAEITLEVDKYVLRKAMILHPATGLPRIFGPDAQFPPDLKADAFHLYNRWVNEDFEQNILRGIITKKGPLRNGDSIDPDYRAKHPASSKYYGSGDLVLGQWWPTQLCTVRDGAHGESQGGISGEKERGTFSIVLSGGGYHDKDDGDTIEYSGTRGKDHKATEATNHMIESKSLGNPIRVIRSSQLNKSNRFRPERGFRYDGLYHVTDFMLVDEETQMYRFHLERLPGQEPIRCEDNAARRPTVFELEEIERLKLKEY